MAKKAILPLEDPPSCDEDERDSDSDSESKEPESPVMKRRRSERTSTAKTGTSLFKRLWSEDDEITLLQCLIDFNAEKGTNPLQDKSGFFEFVKKEVTCKVSQYQVVEKIRSLKRKYIGNSQKRVERSFSKPHENQCLQLAKYIWGSDGNEVFSHTSRDKVVEDDVEEVFGHSGGDSGRDKVAVAEDEVLAQGGQGSGQMAVAEDEVLAPGGQVLGKKLPEEENDKLARGGGGSGKKVVEEEKEDLARGGGGHSESLGVLRDPDWFEKSVLVQSIASYGVADHTIKERWSLFSEETKRKLEEEWKSLESKQLHVVSLKIKYTSELASKFV